MSKPPRPARHPGNADFSPCGRYRHWLERVVVAENSRVLAACLLNPSNAGKDTDDDTVIKMCKYTRAWGCGILVMVNAHDFIETGSMKMVAARKAGVDVIGGSSNTDAICMAVARARNSGGIVFAGWGNSATLERGAELARLLGEPTMCIATNPNGSPIHPLYQRDSATLMPWRCP